MNRTRALYAFVAVAAVLVYANALMNGFALDDLFVIERNPRVTGPFSLPTVLLTPYWPQHGAGLGLYRPTAILAYALEWHASGGAPAFFHAVSILLHAGASLLAFSVLRRFTTGAAAGTVGMETGRRLRAALSARGRRERECRDGTRAAAAD